MQVESITADARLGLQWEDVDLAGGALTVRHAPQRVNGKLELAETKSDSSRRRVVLPPVAVEQLKQHRASQNRERLVAGSKWVDAGYVFTTTIGTPVDERNLRREFRGLLTAAGLPRIRVHDLRHTCATLLLFQGVNPRVVMQTLGHSQVSLTLGTYSHVLPSLQEDAAERMNALLTATPTEKTA